MLKQFHIYSEEHMLTTHTALVWNLSKPALPEIGDCYYDATTKTDLVFNGVAWQILLHSRDTHSSPVPTPTAEQLQRYPELDQVWKNYLSVRNNIGI